MTAFLLFISGQNLTDPVHLIQYGGILLLLAIIYLETAVFLGLILPGGDYMIFTAGLLCGTHYLDFPFAFLIITMMIAAILGDFTGYTKGRWFGPKLFNKSDARIFKQSYLLKTRRFYEKFGIWAFVAGRFMPVIRTLIPMLAGASGISPVRFTYMNISGAVVWIGSLASLGYYLGNTYPGLINYSHYFLILIFVLASFPLFKLFLPESAKKMTQRWNPFRKK